MTPTNNLCAVSGFKKPEAYHYSYPWFQLGDFAFHYEQIGGGFRIDVTKNKRLLFLSKQKFFDVTAPIKRFFLQVIQTDKGPRTSPYRLFVEYTDGRKEEVTFASSLGKARTRKDYWVKVNGRKINLLDAMMDGTCQEEWLELFKPEEYPAASFDDQYPSYVTREQAKEMIDLAGKRMIGLVGLRQLVKAGAIRTNHRRLLNRRDVEQVIDSSGIVDCAEELNAEVKNVREALQPKDYVFAADRYFIWRPWIEEQKRRSYRLVTVQLLADILGKNTDLLAHKLKNPKRILGEANIRRMFPQQMANAVLSEPPSRNLLEKTFWGTYVHQYPVRGLAIDIQTAWAMIQLFRERRENQSHEITVPELAARTGLSKVAIRRGIRQGLIPSRQDVFRDESSATYKIPKAEAEFQQLAVVQYESKILLLTPKLKTKRIQSWQHLKEILSCHWISIGELRKKWFYLESTAEIHRLREKGKLPGVRIRNPLQKKGEWYFPLHKVKEVEEEERRKVEKIIRSMKSFTVLAMQCLQDILSVVQAEHWFEAGDLAKRWGMSATAIHQKITKKKIKTIFMDVLGSGIQRHLIPPQEVVRLEEEDLKKLEENIHFVRGYTSNPVRNKEELLEVTRFWPQVSNLEEQTKESKKYIERAIQEKKLLATRIHILGQNRPYYLIPPQEAQLWLWKWVLNKIRKGKFREDMIGALKPLPLSYVQPEIRKDFISANFAFELARRMGVTPIHPDTLREFVREGWVEQNENRQYNTADIIRALHAGRLDKTAQILDIHPDQVLNEAVDHADAVPVNGECYIPLEWINEVRALQYQLVPVSFAARELGWSAEETNQLLREESRLAKLFWTRNYAGEPMEPLIHIRELAKYVESRQQLPGGEALAEASSLGRTRQQLLDSMVSGTFKEKWLEEAGLSAQARWVSFSVVLRLLRIKGMPMLKRRLKNPKRFWGEEIIRKYFTPEMAEEIWMKKYREAKQEKTVMSAASSLGSQIKKRMRLVRQREDYAIEVNGRKINLLDAMMDGTFQEEWLELFKPPLRPRISFEGQFTMWVTLEEAVRMMEAADRRKLKTNELQELVRLKIIRTDSRDRLNRLDVEKIIDSSNIAECKNELQIENRAVRRMLKPSSFRLVLSQYFIWRAWIEREIQKIHRLVPVKVLAAVLGTNREVLTNRLRNPVKYLGEEDILRLFPKETADARRKGKGGLLEMSSAGGYIHGGSIQGLAVDIRTAWTLIRLYRESKNLDSGISMAPFSSQAGLVPRAVSKRIPSGEIQDEITSELDDLLLLRYEKKVLPHSKQFKGKYIRSWEQLMRILSGEWISKQALSKRWSVSDGEIKALEKQGVLPGVRIKRSSVKYGEWYFPLYKVHEVEEQEKRKLQKAILFFGRYTRRPIRNVQDVLKVLKEEQWLTSPALADRWRISNAAVNQWINKRKLGAFYLDLLGAGIPRYVIAPQEIARFEEQSDRLLEQNMKFVRRYTSDPVRNEQELNRAIRFWPKLEHLSNSTGKDVRAIVRQASRGSLPATCIRLLGRGRAFYVVPPQEARIWLWNWALKEMKRGRFNEQMAEKIKPVAFFVPPFDNKTEFIIFRTAIGIARKRGLQSVKKDALRAFVREGWVGQNGEGSYHTADLLRALHSGRLKKTAQILDIHPDEVLDEAVDEEEALPVGDECFISLEWINEVRALQYQLIPVSLAARKLGWSAEETNHLLREENRLAKPFWTRNYAGEPIEPLIHIRELWGYVQSKQRSESQTALVAASSLGQAQAQLQTKALRLVTQFCGGIAREGKAPEVFLDSVFCSESETIRIPGIPFLIQNGQTRDKLLRMA
ncbi:MAG: hypothetical protein HY586_00340 [Candidatus Omnitrophica bacterium]|nr:hypothetical protein [Candidatus Omnitrophota bacterium]